MESVTTRRILVSDETWVALALLHREYPGREDFTITEIVERAKRESLTESLRPGVRVHATLHCVANLPPNPGRYRMLYATGKHTRRLYRPGDSYHPQREGARTLPNEADLPEPYRKLLTWYEDEYLKKQAPESSAEDPLLALCGSGKGLWKDEDPDSYVRRIRKGWE
jgi:hypothetical protein